MFVKVLKRERVEGILLEPGTFREIPDSMAKDLVERGVVRSSGAISSDNSLPDGTNLLPGQRLLVKQ